MEQHAQLKIAHQRVAAGIALLAVVLATCFIVRSYRVTNQTYDESAHIACGMEWLSQHTYYYETLHPPIARASAALLPYLAGARSQGKPEMLEEGKALLTLHGAYWHNLTLSRLGILPFFWFVCLLVFAFMSRHYGPLAGAAATVLLAFCPPLLAHAGLATTDAPLVAMYTWSVMQCWRFLRTPTLSNALLLAVAFSLAALTKFTELPFFLIAATVLVVYIGVRRRAFPFPARYLVLIPCLMAFIIWATYFFSFAPVFNRHTLSPSSTARLETVSPAERKVLTQVPVPADEFLRGLIMARGTGATGRDSFLLGQIYHGGKWDFFPVAFLAKTPIAFLILFGMGMGFTLARRRAAADSDAVMLFTGFAAPLCVGIAGSMNIGLRHVLPVYPFAAMIGALGFSRLWDIASERRWIGLKIGGIILLCWSVVSCTISAPHFISYFNELARPYASHILVNSDFDWGQDFFALEQRLRQEHATAVTLIYFGDPDIDMSGMPQPYTESLNGRRSGWIAISETLYQEEPQEFGWMAKYPYERVGETIRLYHIPPANL